MSLKVGIIGVGYLGSLHARVYSELDGVELAGVSDTDEKKAEEVSKKYGCRAFNDHMAMLPHVRAVSIVTPTESHYGIAMDCLRAGKDIMLEKPMTSAVSEADRLIEEAEKKGLILQVGHLERFNPAVAELAALIEEPLFFESERLSPFVQRSAGVDVTLDLMIHDIDIIMSLLSSPEVKDIKVTGAKVITDKYDVAKAWIDFEGGVSALITASRLADKKLRRLRVFQKTSYIELDYQAMEIRRHFRNGKGIATETIKAEGKEPLKEELRGFVGCVLGKKRPKVSGIEGRNALKVALDITERIGK